MNEIGRALVLFGIVLVAVGLLLATADKLPWLGRLPGDIFIKRDQFRLYFPLTTSLLISVVLTFLLYLLRR
jgi:uncharacterized protein HemY